MGKLNGTDTNISPNHVFMAGAYGATASPASFLGHGPAQEVIIGK